MMNRENAGQPNTRRGFFKSAAVVAAGAGVAGRSAHAAETNATQSPVFVNAKDFGAQGDGEAHDAEALSQAIAHAKRNRVAAVFLPAGVYMLEKTLYLPSNVALVGAGRENTRLKAVADTLFDMYRPDPRTAEIRQRRTLITTESVSTVREEVTENIAIRHLTVDWNNCPTDSYGHSVALMDSCDRAFIEDAAFVNCMPSDHPDTGEGIGSRFRCECVMYSNARYGLMDNVLLTDSGYRPLSVAYGSKKITFQNGVIHAENPVWRHVFCENHGDGITRDENFVHAEVIFLNSTFILDGGTGHDGICSHTGTTHVENCDFYISPDAATFRIILRPFDGSRNCRYINNRFHCDRRYHSALQIMATTTRDPADWDNQNRSITFAGNIVDLSYDADVDDRTSAAVNFPAGDRRIHVRDNQFHIHWDGPVRAPVIALRGAESFSVVHNVIEIEAPNDAGSAVGIVVRDSKQGQILGNTVAGDIGVGIELTGASNEVAVVANSVADVSEVGSKDDAEATTDS